MCIHHYFQVAAGFPSSDCDLVCGVNQDAFYMPRLRPKKKENKQSKDRSSQPHDFCITSQELPSLIVVFATEILWIGSAANSEKDLKQVIPSVLQELLQFIKKDTRYYGDYLQANRSTN